MKAGIQFELTANALPGDVDQHLEGHIAAACGVPKNDILSYRILKRSLDARKKPAVKLLYQVVAEIRNGVVPKKKTDAPPADTPAYHAPENKRNLKHPLIVGAGPAGLFAALVLAEAGAEPVVLDRGRDVLRRKQDIDRFFQTRTLNPESNLLFGEGGAGTWSDGKLYTRVRDSHIPWVLDAMIRAGAPEQIRYFSHPHIGSDKLPDVIAGIRERILASGGTFQWDSRVKGIIRKNERFHAVQLVDGTVLEAPAVLFAPGHSARDLILSLTDSGVSYAMKGFQIGCRIEHPQSFINYIQFGNAETNPALGAAEYLYSSRGFPERNIAGATTFCMCPGGEILPATSEENALCTNGMSNSARSGEFANSAVISALPPGSFETPREAFDFLSDLEQNLFRAGGGNYVCPAQNATDFVNRKSGRLPKTNSYRLGLRQARVDNLLPAPIYEALACALKHFDRMAPGFLREGVVTGMETRVSSPVRFIRNPETLETSVENLYIAGEGGGMAGGIISAALDGIRLAEALLSKK